MRITRTGVIAVAIGMAALATLWGLAISVVVGGSGDGWTDLPTIAEPRDLGTESVVLRAKWGAGKGQVGLSNAGETIGPSSFGVDDRGRVYVLDRVNARVLRFVDGTQDDAWTLPDTGFEDIRVAGDFFAVLSRFENRRVLVVNSDTDEVKTLPIDDAVPDIFAFEIVGTDILVTAPNRNSIDRHVIGTLDGSVASSVEQVKRRADGMLGLNGEIYRVKRLDDRTISLNVMHRTGPGIKLKLRSGRDVPGITDLFCDTSGCIYMAYAVYDYVDTTPESDDGRVALVKFGADGTLLGAVETSEDPLPEVVRNFCLGGDGRVYQLRSEEGGIRVVSWELATTDLLPAGGR